MIGRTNRFHGQSSLRKVYSNGKSVRGGLIGLKYLQRNVNKPYRVAVVVSKKVHKSAVARNRIRRRIYEVIRVSEVQPKNGCDMIFTVFGEQAKDMPSDKLQALVAELIQKANQA